MSPYPSTLYVGVTLVKCIPQYNLYGRDVELDKLSRLLSPKSSFTGVAIEAMGGMGKTALAREYCITREIWKSYDIVLGAQALKRQMRLDTRAPKSGVVRFDEQGTVLRLREFLVEIARQLFIQKPELLTETELEREIRRCLEGRSALIIIDNLETMNDTIDLLALCQRVCLPPIQKVLITTRQFPDNARTGFEPLSLSAIQDTLACRHLVVDRLNCHIDHWSASNDAIDAIIEVGRGHPLALELLVGKLVTQGEGSVLELRKKWRSNAADALNDVYLSALCDYVFDHRFLEHIGSGGEDLLSVIALEDAGVDEEAARSASNMSEEEFESTLSKLFQSNCIHRVPFEDLIVLTMHPLTQAYFRGISA